MEIQNDNTNCSMQPWLHDGRLLFMGNNKKLSIMATIKQTIQLIQFKIK